jgi:hypothetical protein
MRGASLSEFTPLLLAEKVTASAIYSSHGCSDQDWHQDADPGTGNCCEEKVDDDDQESCKSMRWTTGQRNVPCVEGAETCAAVLTSTELDGSTAPPATGDAENASQNFVRAEVTEFDSLETPFLEVCMHPLAYTIGSVFKPLGPI